MAPSEPEDVFKVTDRRRRLDDDDAPRPAPAAAEPPQVSPVDLSPAGERSLAGLFMMLASSAVVALGEAPDPLTGQRQVDLAQAADAIDLLILLREKTEGNRSPEENRILEEVLYDLQLRYVHATKPS
jgi:hypothetical protein